MSLVGPPLSDFDAYLLFFYLCSWQLNSDMLGRHSTSQPHLQPFGTLSKSERCHIAIKG